MFTRESRNVVAAVKYIHVAERKGLFVCVSEVSGVSGPLHSGSSVGNRLSCGSDYLLKTATTEAYSSVCPFKH